jgi:hypothetical protein
MLCRNCGTEIADKAIVCYRCGTGTSEPARKPAEIRPRRSPVLPVAVLVILLVLAWYLGRYYHVLGLELPPELACSQDAAYSLTVLIDFPAIHA